MIKAYKFFIASLISSVIISLIFYLMNGSIYILILNIALYFIIITSIFIIPFSIYNHLSYSSALKGLRKYSISSLKNTYNFSDSYFVIIKNNNFDVNKSVMENNDIEALICINDTYLLFFQSADFNIISDVPFISLKINDITEISQKNKSILFPAVSYNIELKCTFFDLKTYYNAYKLLILHGKTDKFIINLIKKRNNLFI
ncbi:hypothetical protein [Acidiplasma cupricumulans]|uniref:Uncharacterized protein n=1 Tax=Acidiplasma cupricumulans TaxID=312540 RepID=A0A0Q0RZ24_9ARCH|nr:hypothetical protein [Acidiplasma cupricumulans]KQB35673.1 hypothetical protein AOG55_00055 [Acidiplasma cupricumulans]